MDKTEYWLLDSAVELRHPLKSLASEDVELSHNRRSHGLGVAALTDLLHRLFEDGWLLAERRGGPPPLGAFVPTRPEIEAALAGEQCIYYGLSAQGGARWEAVSKPDWERYVSASFGTSPNEGEIIAARRQSVERYDSLPAYPSGVSVTDGSRRWDVLKPWPATYWKTLPAGHRLRFRYTWDAEAPAKEIPPPAAEAYDLLGKWYQRYAE
jgi:hypothetical protein